MRIVSLLPAASEIVFALGMGNELVGRSHECDYPAEVKQLPSLTRPKFDSERESGIIDREVTNLIQNGLSVYEVDVDLLRMLQPDVIITQSQCEACAVDYNAIEKAAHQLLDQGTIIVDLQPDDLGKIWEDFRRIGEAIERTDTANELIKDCKDSIEKVKQQVKSEYQPTVGMIEWLDPLMNAGNWMPELVKLAGGKSVLEGDNKPKKSHYIDFDNLLIEDPDFLVIIPCGYSIEQARREMSLLEQNDNWEKLSAVKNDQVYLADANHYFNRPGPRIAESVGILAEILHPDLFEPQFEGEGWERYELPNHG